MTEGDQSLWVTSIILQECTSSLSFLASTSIAVMIARKTPSGEGGLSTPYRRLIFGISIADIFQSFALLTGPWSPPPDETHALWGRGNSFTCKMNGVLLTLGVSPVPMYVCCLCIYYLCKLKLQMSDDAFTQRYEKKMHGFIVSLNVGLVIASLAMDTIHTTVPGTFCHFAALPTGCRQEPDLYGECEPRLAFHVQNLLLVNSVMIPFFSLVGIVTTMIMLFRNVLQRERIFQASYGHKRRKSVPTSNDCINLGTVPATVADTHNPTTSPLQEEVATGSSNEIPSKVPCESELCSDNKDSSCTAKQQTEHQPQEVESQEQEVANEKEIEAERLARLYRKETMLQAFLYVGAFCASFFPTWLYIMFLLSGVSNYSQLISILEIFLGICYPVQGLLNIIVYTRPFVASLRRRHPECSWLNAFFLVFAAGGEVPNDIDPERLTRFRCCTQGKDKDIADNGNGNNNVDDTIAVIDSDLAQKIRQSRSSIKSEAFGVAHMPIKLEVQAKQAVDGICELDRREAQSESDLSISQDFSDEMIFSSGMSYESISGVASGLFY